MKAISHTSDSGLRCSSERAHTSNMLTFAEIDVDGALREAADGCRRAASSCAVGPGRRRWASWPRAAPRGGTGPASKRDQAKQTAATWRSSTSRWCSSICRRPSTPRPSVSGRSRRAGRAGSRRRLPRARACQGVPQGARPRRDQEPDFNFRGVTDSPKSFRATAVAFEDLAVGAYKEQLPTISSNAYLAAAISIHSVEARHAAWIRYLAGIVPADHAFDEPCQTTRRCRSSTPHISWTCTPRGRAPHAPAFTG